MNWRKALETFSQSCMSVHKHSINHIGKLITKGYHFSEEKHKMYAGTIFKNTEKWPKVKEYMFNLSVSNSLTDRAQLPID